MHTGTGEIRCTTLRWQPSRKGRVVCVWLHEIIFHQPVHWQMAYGCISRTDILFFITFINYCTCNLLKTYTYSRLLVREDDLTLSCCISPAAALVPVVVVSVCVFLSMSCSVLPGSVSSTLHFIDGSIFLRDELSVFFLRGSWRDCWSYAAALPCDRSVNAAAPWSESWPVAAAVVWSMVVGLRVRPRSDSLNTSCTIAALLHCQIS